MPVRRSRSGLGELACFLNHELTGFQWAVDNDQARQNPVDLARPKAPKTYQTERTQALSDEEAIRLLAMVRDKARTGDLVGLRDYALMLFYFFSGCRRREIIQLRWGDINLSQGIVITTQVKGGDYDAFEVKHPEARVALLDYLKASGRLMEMQPDSPLWTAHDRTERYTSRPLTSHTFAHNLKQYARAAGLSNIHLHQTRHTVARWVGEESGSLLEAQEALGHKNLTTTKIYLNRVAVKRDKFSDKIATRLQLEK